MMDTFRFVVIDETHMYKGAFGCHSALILRRLRRICSHGTLWHFHLKQVVSLYNVAFVFFAQASVFLIYAVHGSDPSFIFCTATSANPREHAMVCYEPSDYNIFFFYFN